MSRFGKIVLIFMALGVLLACSLLTNAAPTNQSDVATIVAGTLQAVTEASRTGVSQSALTPASNSTAAQGPVPQGLTVNYLNITLVIPANLAKGTTNTRTVDVEFPFINPSLGDMPQHAKIVLTGYPVQGMILQPQILVFKADEYSQYSDLSQQVVSSLRTMHYQNGQSLPKGLPAGPFNASVQSVNFAHGMGIRYLTQFDESPLPVNNRELIYYFHGITNDGSFYVQVILPVQAPFLAPDDNPNSPLPKNGIPFSSDQSYFAAVQQQLNATAPDRFSPQLASLDALIQSITITP
jgi:hypothetical protein